MPQTPMTNSEAGTQTTPSSMNQPQVRIGGCSHRLQFEHAPCA